MGSGEIPLSDVWAMLSACAPGHTRRLTKHYYSIQFSGKVYPSFPKGAHGKADPLIEKGHIRKMVRFFEIVECAKKTLNL